MKMKKYFVFIFICCAFISLTRSDAFSQTEKNNRKISVKLDGFPKADKSNILDDTTLSKLMPELKKPKLFSVNDLYDEYERNICKKGKCTFVIQGDFKNNGNIDIAFIVKDKSRAKKKNVYLVIINIQGKAIIRDYFCDLGNDRAYLEMRKNFRYKPGIDTIFIGYTLLGSDWCAYIYWNGQHYVVYTCDEETDKQIKEK